MTKQKLNRGKQYVFQFKQSPQELFWFYVMLFEQWKALPLWNGLCLVPSCHVISYCEVRQPEHTLIHLLLLSFTIFTVCSVHSISCILLLRPCVSLNKTFKTELLFVFLLNQATLLSHLVVRQIYLSRESNSNKRCHPFLE